MYSRARDRCREMLAESRHSEDPWGHVALAVIECRTGDPPAAEKRLREWLRSTQVYKAAIQLVSEGKARDVAGQVETALDFPRGILPSGESRGYPRPDAETLILFTISLDLYRQGRVRDALAVFESEGTPFRAYSRNRVLTAWGLEFPEKGHGGLIPLRGACKLALGDFKGAAGDAKEVMKAEHGRGPAWNKMVETMRRAAREKRQWELPAGVPLEGLDLFLPYE